MADTEMAAQEAVDQLVLCGLPEDEAKRVVNEAVEFFSLTPPRSGPTCLRASGLACNAEPSCGGFDCSRTGSGDA